MIRCYGIRNCHLYVLSCLFCSASSSLKVSRVVTCIENSENSDTVICSCFDELVYNIVSIVSVAKKILSTKQHHDWCIRKSCMKFSKTLPWIFVQETDTRVVCCTTPSFKACISNFIEFVADRKHISRSHTCSMQRLMSVAKNQI